MTEFDIIAREVSGYRTRFEVIERRLGEIDKVIGRLEAAALTTARALQEISRHWGRSVRGDAARGKIRYEPPRRRARQFAPEQALTALTTSS